MENQYWQFSQKKRAMQLKSREYRFDAIKSRDGKYYLRLENGKFLSINSKGNFAMVNLNTYSVNTTTNKEDGLVFKLAPSKKSVSQETCKLETIEQPLTLGANRSAMHNHLEQASTTSAVSRKNNFPANNRLQIQQTPLNPRMEQTRQASMDTKHHQPFSEELTNTNVDGLSASQAKSLLGILPKYDVYLESVGVKHTSITKLAIDSKKLKRFSSAGDAMYIPRQIRYIRKYCLFFLSTLCICNTQSQFQYNGTWVTNNIQIIGFKDTKQFKLAPTPELFVQEFTQRLIQMYGNLAVSMLLVRTDQISNKPKQSFIDNEEYCATDKHAMISIKNTTLSSFIQSMEYQLHGKICGTDFPKLEEIAQSGGINWNNFWQQNQNTNECQVPWSQETENSKTIKESMEVEPDNGKGFSEKPEIRIADNKSHTTSAEHNSESHTKSIVNVWLKDYTFDFDIPDLSKFYTRK
ncbi:hypothetical protein RFI_00547 [Reticulomyxa filosa]|uniref:Uncharacterized protein n=1 Tax=Reticulomyxa filosa TaxID=46433 RepID=X6PEP7_RETFI|nr:hypothetical protein RFI_00547 [Reticulomyxa filosa]|eukprot:ETO36514.1 hypothetical protein RFI_00547 [Reticulomyxa filosa]